MTTQSPTRLCQLQNMVEKLFPSPEETANQQPNASLSQTGTRLIDALQRAGTFSWMGIASINDSSPIPQAVLYLREHLESEEQRDARPLGGDPILPAFDAFAEEFRAQSQTYLGLALVNGEKLTVDQFKQITIEKASNQGRGVNFIYEHYLPCRR